MSIDNSASSVLTFTFHNVSINSFLLDCICNIRSNYLHSIMYLLILWFGLQGFIKEYYLHSIMYLLIRGLHQKRCDHRIQFTFHNVSINSIFFPFPSGINPDLHSIMYLLIPVLSPYLPSIFKYLHSIMYLLIPVLQLPLYHL